MGRDQDKQQHQAEELSMAAALEAQKARRKAHVGDDAAAGVATAPEPALPVVDDKVESKCHVCNAALRRLRVRHHCHNCMRPVCGEHSKNHVPLPHLGIMHEVRVCDICLRQLVQRRAGYRSPKRRSQVGRGSFIQHDNDDHSDEASSLLVSDKLSSPSSSGMPPLSTTSSASCNSIAAVRLLLTSSSSSQSGSTTESLIDPMSGVIYICLLEEQYNMVDEILYLGTFTVDGRSLASRCMSANVAIDLYS